MAKLWGSIPTSNTELAVRCRDRVSALVLSADASTESWLCWLRVQSRSSQPHVNSCRTEFWSPKVRVSARRIYASLESIFFVGNVV